MEQIKKHNGYIVPFDIPSESLKKGDILRHKNGLDDDMFENIVILNSSYCLPPEWVETWEKYYHEEVKKTAVNYLIHSINEDMFQLSKSEAEWKEIFKKAKEMEEKQMEDFIEWCLQNGWTKYKGLDRWKYIGQKEVFGIKINEIKAPKTTSELLQIFTGQLNETFNQ